MSELNWEPLPSGGGIGTLPGWDKKWYPSEEKYRQAYREEENEIVDALAELEAERFTEYPEDYLWMA